MAADGTTDDRDDAKLSGTIFALSSGSPPAAIAVVRISGPDALTAAATLGVDRLSARRARYAELWSSGELLDRAIILFFDAPRTATGEDVIELHLHGGRAVVAGVLRALETVPGLRAARAGEFTRRAFDNGRLDLAEAEGLADLLTAETDLQRRAALGLAGGALSRQVKRWADELLSLAGEVEAMLDFDDEPDVAEELPTSWHTRLEDLCSAIAAALAQPPAERLRDGVRVVIAGPPNVGKSTLLNRLVQRDAAITAASPGTTRDVVEAPVSLHGVPIVFADTAGIRDTVDEVEQIGVQRAQLAMRAADLILWLGDPLDAPRSGETIVVRSRSDLIGADPAADVSVSAFTGEGISELIDKILVLTRRQLPHGELALNARHRALLEQATAFLEDARVGIDLLIVAECLRGARVAFDHISGRAGMEEMLDGVFARFCIGK